MKAPERLFDETVVVVAWRGPSSALAARWGIDHGELLRRLRIHGVKSKQRIMLEVISEPAMALSLIHISEPTRPY